MLIETVNDIPAWSNQKPLGPEAQQIYDKAERMKIEKIFKCTADTDAPTEISRMKNATASALIKLKREYPDRVYKKNIRGNNVYFSRLE